MQYSLSKCIRFFDILTGKQNLLQKMLFKNFFVQKPGSRKEKKGSICENKLLY